MRLVEGEATFDLGSLDAGDPTDRGIPREAATGEASAAAVSFGILETTGLSTAGLGGRLGVPSALSKFARATTGAVAAGIPGADFVDMVARRFANMSFDELGILSTTPCKLADPPWICSKLLMSILSLLDMSITHAMTLRAAFLVPESEMHFARIS